MKHSLSPDLSGKIALVTGAGRGIGRSIAQALADSGAHVVLAARTAGQIKALADEITADGGQATAIATDVADEAGVRKLLAETSKIGPLDILINCAGIGRFGALQDFSTQDFDTILAVNLRGTFLCCREAMRIMAAENAGFIINISSVVGIKGYPNQAAYTASKHGVVGLTKSLAIEAQEHNVRVSVILPGGVDTELVAQARPDLDRSILMHPEDISQAVLYLLSLSDRAHVDQIYIRRRSSSPF
ncbi:MAG: SDR family NAD(P)-dependent oxidoreductase [Actinobacteria bacterium]|nr:SDR family NAD(P)-dependent oxidoreductase [Actinomycetota bacterium]